MIFISPPDNSIFVWILRELDLGKHSVQHSSTSRRANDVAGAYYESGRRDEINDVKFGVIGDLVAARCGGSHFPFSGGYPGDREGMTQRSERYSSSHFGLSQARFRLR